MSNENEERQRRFAEFAAGSESATVARVRRIVEGLEAGNLRLVAEGKLPPTHPGAGLKEAAKAIEELKKVLGLTI